MKTLTLLLSLSTLILTAAPSRAFELWGLRVGNTPARVIARDSSVKGKCVQGECLPYALDLAKKLRASGIPSQVIGYRYGEMLAGTRDWGQIRGHAVVVYQDGGRTYLMDNQSWTPRWVENAPDNHMAVQFEGMNTRIVRAWKMNESRTPTGTRISKHQRMSEVAHSTTRHELGSKIKG